ncbi:unnamed protein product [Cylicocyclus nassatus]|uniref:Uncharacterized protein n=1 Tax=Cylicocyclus nassatus TaxID=53992 RepID=A0AA36M9N9_CYLNA|nr:unnamed protein product [Cylicocyclus nassatus]
MRLLQMDDEQLEAARSKDQMAKFRDEVLSSIDLKNDSIDLGTTIERSALEDKDQLHLLNVIFIWILGIQVTIQAESRTASTTDSGLEVDFEAPVVSSRKESTTVSGKKPKKRLRKRKRKEREMVDHLPLECSSSTVFENSEDDIVKDVENLEAVLTKSKRRQSVENSSTVRIVRCVT